MTVLRYLIYGGGGFLLLILWALWASYSDFAQTTPVVVIGPLLAVALLYAFDRSLHTRLYGYRVRFRIKDYRPCSLCPFTKEVGTIPKYLSTHYHVGAIIFYKFVILVSASFADQNPEDELRRIPGVRIVRITHTEVVLYIKDRDYYSAFVAQNERALVG